MARRCNIVNDLVVASMISFEISFDLLERQLHPGAISSMRVFDPNDTASYMCLGTLAVY